MRFSSNSETELLENLVDMFPRYYIYSDNVAASNLQQYQCVNRQEMVNSSMLELNFYGQIVLWIWKELITGYSQLFITHLLLLYVTRRHFNSKANASELLEKIVNFALTKWLK